MSDLGFLEIETPILTKPTPEGARDYLVPSRVHPGEFYALPQSPQIYKQLLMVSGFDRYFQIARCFRDEDLRFDRQPEFTQIDIEASFVGPEDVQRFVEAVLVACWAEAGQTVASPFPRLAWRDAMARYGSDKPDLRYDIRLADWTKEFTSWTDLPLAGALASDARNRLEGFLVPGGATLSRKEIDALSEIAKRAVGKTVVWCKRQGEQLSGSVKLTAERTAALGMTDGALAVMLFGAPTEIRPVLGTLRVETIRRLKLAPSTAHAFCWVVDFPLFEPDPDTGKPVFAHHPFTAPHPEDIGKLDSEPLACRALHYDAVYNGHELGSGSIRITDPAVQRTVFRHLGLSPEEIESRFGFLLRALAAGAPPHGGFAVGFDRVAMLLAQATSLRDVIAFPKTTAARALFEGAPSPARAEDIAALHLEVTR